MMVFFVSLAVMGNGLVMIIKYEHRVLLVQARDNILSVPVFALVKLFEETELVGNVVIGVRVEIQAEPSRERRQSLLPFAQLDLLDNVTDDEQDKEPQGDQAKVIRAMRAV